MTVLPYIVVSLLHSIGGLTYETAKQLAGRAPRWSIIRDVLHWVD